MIIKKTRSNTVSIAIRELYSRKKVLEWARGTGRAGDAIEAAATHIVYEDEEFNTDLFDKKE